MNRKQLNKKQLNKQLYKHPKIKKQTEKFANEIAQLLTQQFEKAKEEADLNGGEFKLNLNDDVKNVLEEKGREMSSFIKTMIEDQKKESISKQQYRNHAVKVSIR